MFESPWWLPGPHLQTLWQPLFRKLPEIDVRRERIETPDGDFLDLDWHGECHQPLVILLHGLTGSTRSPYIVGMQSALEIHGFRSLAMNFRGCSGSPNRTWKAYHSGDTDDLRYLIQWLKTKEPETELRAVGFSLGGNVLLKYLGEEGGNSRIEAAVSVSAPIKLASCASRLDSGISRLYRNQLIKELKEYLVVKTRFLRDIGCDEDADRLDALGPLDAVSSFWDYDDRVVARLYGFEDAADYYARSSSYGYLEAIECSTLIIQSMDDPFLTPDVMPTPEEMGAAVRVSSSRSGGHVGFVLGQNPWRPRYWLETKVTNFFQTERR
ncbi:MAG: hypothetical protein RLZ25_243 [Pseudomonadota bacterium]|jgi:predicted alpha/beta-fold hydrolase